MEQLKHQPNTVAGFDPADFDDAFFASYESEMQDVDFAAQAAAALQNVLTVKNVDETDKSYEQIRYDSLAFFANEWVQRDEALLNQMAMQFAEACMSHPHGTQLSQEITLGPMFERGISGMSADDGHGHDSESVHDDHDHDDEIDPKTGKKRKKRCFHVKSR